MLWSQKICLVDYQVLNLNVNMAQWKVPKYSTRRWVPRIWQNFSIIDGDNIFEGKRREFVHDDKIHFPFRNKNQVKFLQNYMNALIDIRDTYEAPEVWEDYYLIKWSDFSIGENFGENVFDWYLYENWFILSKKVPTKIIPEYISSISNYLNVIEDLYIDDYWKSRQQNH